MSSSPTPPTPESPDPPRPNTRGSAAAPGLTSTSGQSGVGGISGMSGMSGMGAQSGMTSMSGQSGVSSSMSGSHGRQTFAVDELAIVLSHYDLGTIEAIKEFPRGSRKAPKLLLRTENGLYLLKRRARDKSDPFKVAYCHSIQLYLASKQFPLPQLIGTRKSNNSILQWKSGIYELFEYIRGTSYDNSLEATADSGKVLALFHKLLKDYHPEYEPPVGSYHASRSVASSFDMIPRTLRRVQPDTMEREGEQIEALVQFLKESYNAAARTVNELGMSDWPMQIVHSDWHPGNMLYRGSRVVAVIDYDAARQQQRVTDIANGALQFSILGGGDDPSKWPNYIDESRFKRFLRAYDSVPDCVLSRAELRTIPWLMVEALIAESVIPIANAGTFARLDGIEFMRMVERKVHWLQEHADALAQVLEG